MCQTATPVKNWRILLELPSATLMPLVTATSACKLCRRCLSSSQQCYLNSRHTVAEYNVVMQELIKMQTFFSKNAHLCSGSIRVCCWITNEPAKLSSKAKIGQQQQTTLGSFTVKPDIKCCTEINMWSTMITLCIQTALQFLFHVDYPTNWNNYTLIFGRQFVKRFALCYQTVVCLFCPVCDDGVLLPNGWMDQDETWHARRPRPGPHCVIWGPTSPLPQKGRAPSNFRPISFVAQWLDGLRCHLVWR